mmetsp:Transcript_6691/g.11739  ORF Transcript_6691/g.11739 Transcript_6691/m.11739 type:complete len:373 (+) Transcript_6691:89-1207(+)
MSSTKLELINTGILMGIIHVLTGPDHLSALATLCGTNIHTQDHSRREAFLLGIRWGIGHSFGLLVVGGLLIAMEESSGDWIGMDPLLSTILEGFVGVFMLALGAYGLFKADKNNRESAVSAALAESFKGSSLESLKLQEEVEIPIRRDTIVAQMEGVLETDSMHESMHELNDSFRWGSRCSFNEMESTCGPSDLSFVTVPIKHPQFSVPSVKPHTPTNLISATSLMNNHTSPDHSMTLSASSYDRAAAHEIYSHLFHGMGRFCTPGVLALVAGVLHGVAGPGGVLGVIPAVQLRDAKLAIIYLGTFCLTSTCVMGGFAAFYGTLSEWLAGGGRGQSGNRVFMVEVGSALLSLCVGFIWLVLLSLGKLDEVFP